MFNSVAETLLEERREREKMQILIFFVAFIFVVQIDAIRDDNYDDDISPDFKYSRLANDVMGGTTKKREKRFVYFFCMNYPDCCDFRGKDVCGYPCPVCPKKKPPPPILDSCKYKIIFDR